MKNKLLLIISIVSAAALAFVITQIPGDTVPIHYGVDGTADRFGSKWMNLLLALIPIVMSVGILYAPKMTQPNETYKEKMVQPLILLFIIFGWVFTVQNLKGAARLDRSIISGIVIALGMLMIWMCNDFGKLQQNRQLGIKLPWTLSNETVWKKTHRIGGYFGVIGGLLMVICGIVSLAIGKPMIAAVGVFAGIVLAVGIPVLYSYVISRSQK